MTEKNRSLFESLHQQYRPMVLQMCMGFVKGDAEQAKDLTQEVFINTWNALDKFRASSSYKTWIYRIAANTCLKYIRDRKDKNNLPIEDVAHPVTELGDAAHEAEHRRLYRAIGKLLEVDRLIIMMVLDELEYEEIANVVGISAVNLRVKIHRIKKNLKQLLQNERSDR